MVGVNAGPGTDTVIRCGIVGYGYMGAIRRGVIVADPSLNLEGVYEPHAPARRAAETERCRVYTSVAELIDSVDAVFVCTPNSITPEVCIEALSKGRHVFCEKPPGRCLRETREMVSAVNGRQKLMFGFNHRFHPGIMRAKVIVDSGRLGSIIGCRGTYGKSGGSGFRESWRNDREVSGGGILLDQGIHMLDLFRYFCGEFDSVKCMVSNSYWHLNVEDNAYVILSTATGVHAMLHSSATQWKHTFRLDVILEHGYLTVEGLLSKSGSYGQERLVVGKRQFEEEAAAVGNPAEEITYFDRDRSWELEVTEFGRCIDEDAPVTTSSAEDALKVMELVAAAYRDAGALPENWL